MKFALSTLPVLSAFAASPEWSIIQKGFSAITIGIGFKNDKVGWTSFTDGSSLPSIVKTTDGGATWNQVKNQTGLHFITTGLAAKKGGLASHVASVGALESDMWSIDGETFVQSLGAPFASQDAKFEGGKLWIGGPNGPCYSKTGGATYKCIKVPLANPQTGRYVSSPVENVIYFTAGSWPSSDPSKRFESQGAETHRQLTRMLKLVSNEETGASRYEFTQESSPKTNDDDTYVAELWKSSDGGETWKSLLSNSGDFYFNDVHCADENNCIAVGEGFAQDGSGDPGARIFLTNDGETFNEVHRESTTGMESLMTARMISTTEYWAGGTTKSGALFAPGLALHSKDGGKSHTNEGISIAGNMFTSMDFLSADHGYATAITGAQTCNLLEFGGSTPPAPSPTPTPGSHHYEKPPCQADEAQASVTGTGGAVCAPACDGSTCPTDVPEGVTAQPTCTLQDQSGNKYCALMCDSDNHCDSGGGAACAHPTAGQPGICVYTTGSTTNALPMFMPSAITV
jgi:photosystem II stability/assembly factor-like uncharacterized protein